MHEDLKKKLRIKEKELHYAKGKIKELEEKQGALEKSWRGSELVNEILQKQIALK